MLIPAALLAFTIVTVFVVALRPLAFSVGLVDRPGGRKSHIGNVPLVGGVSMYLGLVVGLALLPGNLLAHPYLPLAAGLLIVIGLLDDRFGVPVAVRFLAQFVAVLFMFYGAGLMLNDMGDPFGIGIISTGPFALLFTALVAMATINAFNVVDGVDGLAGSLAHVSLLALALAGFIGGGDIALPMIACASIFGFMLFNYPTIQNRRVRAFMGDAGSTMLGLVVVWATIGISQGEARLMSPVICLWFASVPIYDLFTRIVRRIQKGKSPFDGGREHFHHTLKRGGFGVRQILGILTGLQLSHACLGLAGLYLGVPDVVMFAAWAIAGLTQHQVLLAVAKRHRLVLRRNGSFGLCSMTDSLRTF